MNTIKTILLAGSLCLLTTALVAGTPDPYPAYATTGTWLSTTTNWAIIGCHSSNAGTPVITYLNATSDKSGSMLQFYTCGSPAIITGANTSTTIPIKTNSVAGFVANATIIIQHLADDTYVRRSVTSCTSTSMVVNAAVTTAAGDRAWVCTRSGLIPVGAANVAITGPGIYMGQPQKPMLIDLDTTAATADGIYAVAATFIK